MRRNCQRRNNGKGKETKAHQANTEGTGEQEPDDGYAPLETPSYVSKESAGQARTLDDEEREKLLARIMDEPGF